MPPISKNLFFNDPIGLWNLKLREGPFPALLSTYVIYWDWSTQCSQLPVILLPCSPLMLTHFLSILWQFSFLFVLNSEFRRIFDILFYFWISTYSFLLKHYCKCKSKSGLTVVGCRYRAIMWPLKSHSSKSRTKVTILIINIVQYSTVHYRSPSSSSGSWPLSSPCP